MCSIKKYTSTINPNLTTIYIHMRNDIVQELIIYVRCYCISEVIYACFPIRVLSRSDAKLT